MTAINNILFATDFSENSYNARDFALETALNSGATLHIMHSIEEPYDFAPMIEEVKNSLNERVKKLFDTMMDEIKEDEKYEEITIETYIQTGRAIYTIMEEVKNQDIDLIVMGAKGRTGLGRFFWGSTTADVVQRSKVPVLAVPKESSYDGFQKVVFATDYNDGDLEALQFVTGLAELYDSKINIFHSSGKKDLKAEIMFRGFQEMVTEQNSYPNIEFEAAESESFFEAIINKIENDNISLLVMVHYDKSFPPLPKQESKEMSYYTEVPLLVLPGSEFINSGNS
ncbi:universal stress protein [Fodinibius sp. AD559]|uniref:universal stress protein n=1 Tax=Fodinibius sp. AD559 TaxID=3424179 RepID=UPI004046F2E8